MSTQYYFLVKPLTQYVVLTVHFFNSYFKLNFNFLSVALNVYNVYW